LGPGIGVTSKQPFITLEPGDRFHLEKEHGKPADERRGMMKLDGKYKKVDGKEEGKAVIISGPKEHLGKAFHIPDDVGVVKD